RQSFRQSEPKWSFGTGCSWWGRRLACRCGPDARVDLRGRDARVGSRDGYPTTELFAAAFMRQEGSSRRSACRVQIQLAPLARSCRNGLVNSKIRRALALLFFLAGVPLALAEPPAQEKPTLVIVVGAPGGDEFGAAF